MTAMEFWSPVTVSLQVTVAASWFSFLLALAAAWASTRRRWANHVAMETLFMLPLVLPPSVVGYGLLVLLGRESWFGQWLETLWGQPLVFTWWAAVIAATVVAFPLIYQTLKSGFHSHDPELADAARTMGAQEWQIFRYIILPLSWRHLVTGYILGFARALGEFGATLMVAGNIPGKTQTLPTAIYLAVEAGQEETALSWVLMVVLFSFLLMAVSRVMLRKA
ncbi:molybdate ABC transporter permease subunit [Marinithermofilum abyssi]|nr:molybdate ABC transporter permease subunit [Marinithermofilum abyssi]